MLSPRLRAILSTVAGAALLAGLLWYAGPGRVLDAVSRARPSLLALAVFAYAAFFVLRAWRWRILLTPLGGGRAGVGALASITAVGWLLNSFVPMRGGEFARAAMVDRKYGTGFLATAATVAVERVLDVVGIALVASAGLYMLPREVALPGWFSTALEIAWVAPVVCVTLLLAAVRARARVDRVVGFVTRPLPQSWQAKVARAVDALIAGARMLVDNPRALVTLLPLTAVMSLAQVAIFVLIFLAFAPGTPVAILLAGFPFFLLSFAVTITPGNVGTYELAFAAVFTALGLPASLVVPLAVLTHVATSLIVTLLGALAIASLGWDILPARRREPAALPQEVAG